MQLGVHAAFGATDQAAEIPLFTARLDAVRCAFRYVASIITVLRSAPADDSPSIIRAKTPIYTDEGSGDVIVMVHGMGDLKEENRFLAAALVSAGFRPISMDLRGMGASTANWPSYTNAALGSDIVALLDHLEASSAVVIGTSMGAGAAAWAAAQVPARVSNLVLIGPFVRTPRNARSFKGWTQLSMVLGPSPHWGLYWTSLFPTRKPADFSDYKARLMANLREPGRMAATRAIMNAPKTDVEARFGEVRANTLVVMGSKDPDFPEPAREAANVAALLGGKFVMVEGAGHYPQAEMPDVSVTVILDLITAGVQH